MSNYLFMLNVDLNFLCEILMISAMMSLLWSRNNIIILLNFLSILMLLSFKLLIAGVIEFTIVIIMVYQSAIIILFLVNSLHLVNLFWLFWFILLSLSDVFEIVVRSRVESEWVEEDFCVYRRSRIIRSKGLRRDLLKIRKCPPNNFYVYWYFRNWRVFRRKFSTSAAAREHIDYCVKHFGFKGYRGACGCMELIHPWVMTYTSIHCDIR